MQIKMLQHYQDSKVHFYPEQVLSVDDELAKWLIDNRMAEAVQIQDARHLDVSPQFEQAEEPPKPEPLNSTNSEPRKRRGGSQK